MNNERTAKRNGAMPNNKQSWSKPHEVYAEQAVRASRTRETRWRTFFEDVLKRLEQTPADRALVYPFDDLREAKRGRVALEKYMRRHYGTEYVHVIERFDPISVIVMRGKRWRKP